MKRILIYLQFFVILGLYSNSLFAQTYFEARVIENEKSYLEYQVRSVNTSVTPTTATPITQISFEIRWPNTSSADVEVLCSNNYYTIVDGLNAKQTKDAYFWRNFVKSQANPVYSDHNWTTNTWETIVEFKITGTSGTTDFEVAPHSWVAQDLVWAQGAPTATTYFPVVNGAVSNYSYPTLVYTFVWKGGGTGPGASPNYWNQTNNWENECGDATSTGFWPYQTTENIYIPYTGVGGYYPESWKTTSDYSYTCNNALIGNGAHITVPDLSAQVYTSKYFDIAGNLKIVNGGKLYLPALGYATVTGNTDIENTEGIEVQADVTGVGSFIDNGTITYGTTGSGKVETYITNGAVVDSFYIHTVGPTVDVASAGGAPLSAFDLATGSTYAYNWDETQPNTDGWQNIFSNNYLVSTGDGIAFSTTDATDYTLEMTGEFITGNTSPPALTHSNNFNELISNPYPSAIDFDAFYTANNGVIDNVYQIWNPLSGNWETRTGGIGSQQFIQVGQAFFVETNSAGTVQFTNAIRAHSNDAFRETTPNMLTMHVSGGVMGYSDKLIVRFTQESTNGFDVNLDGAKWTSMYADATMIRTIAEDNSELAINVLPLDGLQGKMVSVPVRFNCGYTNDYTFDFEGIDSFEAGNEVWLEDKKDSDHWIYLNDNPHYTFTAASYGNPDRFIIHFFGPTSINDKDEARVDIYSSGQYAYIKNVTNEKIKKVSIYNIAGSLVTSRTIPDGQKLSKIWVSDHMAYYVVQVITESNVYTNKILITK